MLFNFDDKAPETRRVADSLVILPTLGNKNSFISQVALIWVFSNVLQSHAIRILIGNAYVRSNSD